MKFATAPPKVSACAVSDCAYNINGCRAFAVSVNTAAECSTYIPRDEKVSSPKVNAQVGACQRATCVHNMDLECTAKNVSFDRSDGKAECLSFSQR
ncbi:hypothetical protein CFLV_00055 [Corynebacterium flavescens]|uniref:Uncharacterized protein n=1 Tax=Corynebacterium flavescens TaxID=28028 RepID=A0A1L7CIX0_CORFL|nr:MULTISPECIES: DUF1540 domain-containing protein [Corynebacterium]APT85765.1 hypothetical protein CFLV_00055 [Corynebacterium flavescens]KAA8719591.1 DUF1540 domain-containing protein [Corynebacterium flavescens]